MSYRIVRFYRFGPIRRAVIKEGLTLEEAQAHCQDPETSSSTAKGPEARRRTRTIGPWFDGYEHDDADEEPAPEDDPEGWTNREGMPEFNGSFR